MDFSWQFWHHLSFELSISTYTLSCVFYYFLCLYFVLWLFIKFHTSMSFSIFHHNYFDTYVFCFHEKLQTIQMVTSLSYRLGIAQLSSVVRLFHLSFFYVLPNKNWEGKFKYTLLRLNYCRFWTFQLRYQSNTIRILVLISVKRAWCIIF